MRPGTGGQRFAGWSQKNVSSCVPQVIERLKIFVFWTFWAVSVNVVLLKQVVSISWISSTNLNELKVILTKWAIFNIYLLALRLIQPKLPCSLSVLIQKRGTCQGVFLVINRSKCDTLFRASYNSTANLGLVLVTWKESFQSAECTLLLLLYMLHINQM